MGELLHFEDFAVGQVIDLGSYAVTADEIREFASEFDPQPFHLDEAAAEASLLGGLAASGWHVCAMFMRLLADGLAEQIGQHGFKWRSGSEMAQAGLAGETLSGAVTITYQAGFVQTPGNGNFSMPV